MMEAKQPSDSLVFPIEPTDRVIADLVPVSAEPGRWAAFNALRHMNRAWMIRAVDPEMALFRSITAEEESATATFLALKRLNYAGTKKLKHHDHLHKNALFPFSKAIADFLTRVGTGPIQVEMFANLDDPKRILRLRLHLSIPGTGKRVTMVPKAPLHFQLAEGPQDGQRKLVDFADQALALAEKHGFQTVIQYLRDRANFRNRLLYAGSEGYPGLEGDVELDLARARSRTFANLLTFLVIDQHPFKQHFAQQALAAFIRLLNATRGNVSFE
jgi:hypothetical protein